MAQSPSDASPAEMPQGDLDTAKLFGQRVAEVTARFRA
jgi:NAD(P)H dehydrogenase (quinone)